MSNIRLQGNPSGTGTLTIASPNTNSDFTFNLPAANGTIPVLASVTNNGVVFVNGSGQTTSGSALTFDGSTVGAFGGSTVNYRFNANRGTADSNQGARFGFAGVDVYRNDVPLSNTQTQLNFTQTGSDGTRTPYYIDSNGNSIWSPGTGASPSEAMRLTSTGLGIGTSSPVARLGVNLGTATANGGPASWDSTYAVFGTAGSVSGAAVGIGFGTQGGVLTSLAPSNAWQQMNYLASTHVFYRTNAVEAARFTSSGVFDIGTGAGAVGQIQFPATQVASANANTLDDYEEGTWTPVIQFSGGTTGITYSYQAGAYTKVGRLVTLYFNLQFSNKGSSTGTAQLAGFPFTTSAGARGGGAVTYAQSFNTIANMGGFLVLVESSNTIATLRFFNTSTRLSQDLSQGDFTNTTEFWGELTYFV